MLGLNMLWSNIGSKITPILYALITAGTHTHMCYRLHVCYCLVFSAKLIVSVVLIASLPAELDKRQYVKCLLGMSPVT